jgi:hypothetical protein
LARASVRGLACIQHWLGAGLEAIEALLVEYPASGWSATATGRASRISTLSPK